jgi:hypothetical protein
MLNGIMQSVVNLNGAVLSVILTAIMWSILFT